MLDPSASLSLFANVDSALPATATIATVFAATSGYIVASTAASDAVDSDITRVSSQ